MKVVNVFQFYLILFLAVGGAGSAFGDGENENRTRSECINLYIFSPNVPVTNECVKHVEDYQRRSAEQNLQSVNEAANEEAERRRLQAEQEAAERRRRAEQGKAAADKTSDATEKLLVQCTVELNRYSASQDPQEKQRILNEHACICQNNFPEHYQNSLYLAHARKTKCEGQKGKDGKVYNVATGATIPTLSGTASALYKYSGMEALVGFLKTKEGMQLAMIGGMAALQAYMANQQAENMQSNQPVFPTNPAPGPGIVALAPNVPSVAGASTDGGLYDDGVAVNEDGAYGGTDNGEALIPGGANNGRMRGSINFKDYGKFGVKKGKAGRKVSPKLSGGTGGGSSPPSGSGGGGGNGGGGQGLGDTVGAKYASAGGGGGSFIGGGTGGSLFGGGAKKDGFDEMVNKLFGDGSQDGDVAAQNRQIASLFGDAEDVEPWNPAKSASPATSTVKPYPVNPLFKRVTRKHVDVVNAGFHIPGIVADSSEET